MTHSAPNSSKIDGFDPFSFLSSIGAGSATLQFKAGQSVFRQGDPASALYYLQQGRVQISIISSQGKEGVTAIHGPGELFGQEGMFRRSLYRANAVTTGASTIAKIDNKAMMRVMEAQSSLALMFLSFVMWRNVQIEDDLVDHLFNSSEKRLARHLLKLAGRDENGDAFDEAATVIPKTSQEALASRIGTTRGRINFFMNKFRKLGYIDYDGDITVRASLANILIEEGTPERASLLDHSPLSGREGTIPARRPMSDRLEQRACA
jgi:CRP-like cAMP-binding protein